MGEGRKPLEQSWHKDVPDIFRELLRRNLQTFLRGVHLPLYVHSRANGFLRASHRKIALGMQEKGRY